MIAIVAATGFPVDPILGENQPPPLLPLFDRPFVQHVIEALAHAGVTELHVLLCLAPERFGSLLEDGQRWGLRLITHLVRDPARPYERLRAIALGAADAPVLLAVGDRLPRWTGLMDEPTGPRSTPLLLVDRSGAWTGWARIPARDAAALAAATDEARAFAHLRGLPQAREVTVPLLLDARTGVSLVAAHEAVFAGEFPELLRTGREVEPGIWLSRNVVLHPTAQLEPPVYINADCRLLAHVHLGPHAVIGARSVIDEGARVHHAMIMPGSYLGAGVEVADALVDRNLLVNLRLGAAVRVTDAFILGSMQVRRGRGWRRASNGIVAGFLMVLLLPAVVLALLLEGRRSRRVRDCVRLPAQPDPATWVTFPCRHPVLERERSKRCERWCHFLRQFLPGLLQVVQGRSALVGLDPKTPEELLQMPADRRELFLHGENGLVSESYLLHGPIADADQAYTAESYFVAATTWRRNLGILLRYFAGLVLTAPSRTPRSRDADAESD